MGRQKGSTERANRKIGYTGKQIKQAMKGMKENKKQEQDKINATGERKRETDRHFLLSHFLLNHSS